MENFFHRYQQELLLASLAYHWRDRNDYFAGANMFVYFSVQQAENIINGSTTEYRGPDFFVVLDVDYHKPRTCWVVWQEEGRYPDVIVEILSPSTAQNDRTTKKDLYEKVFATEEYFLFDFDKKELIGYELMLGQYQQKVPNERGWLWSAKLGLWLGLWGGEFRRYRDRWLRFWTPEGELVLTGEEAEYQRAELERQRAERAEAELQRLREKLAQQGISLEE